MAYEDSKERYQQGVLATSINEGIYASPQHFYEMFKRSTEGRLPTVNELMTAVNAESNALRTSINGGNVDEMLSHLGEVLMLTVRVANQLGIMWDVFVGEYMDSVTVDQG
jgi:hypothetical protein